MNNYFFAGGGGGVAVKGSNSADTKHNESSNWNFS